MSDEVEVLSGIAVLESRKGRFKQVPRWLGLPDTLQVDEDGNHPVLIYLKFKTGSTTDAAKAYLEREKDIREKYGLDPGDDMELDHQVELAVNVLAEEWIVDWAPEEFGPFSVEGCKEVLMAIAQDSERPGDLMVLRVMEQINQASDPRIKLMEKVEGN